MTTRRGWGVALTELDRAFDPAGSSLDWAGLTDAVLLERFAHHRDEAAFATLVERHGSMVLRTARGIVGSADAADDVFQATFLILARRASTVRLGASVAPWLHRVARRAALRARDRSRRGAHRSGGAGRPPAADSLAAPPALDADRVEANQLLHAEIDRLPTPFRQAVVLCDLEDLSRHEAADRLGWPAGTVASRLARGRRLLRDRLTRRLGGADAWLGAGPGARLAPLPWPVSIPPGLVDRALAAALETLRSAHAGRVSLLGSAAARLGWSLGRLERPLALALAAVVALGATVAVRAGWLGVALPALGNAPPPVGGPQLVASAPTPLARRIVGVVRDEATGQPIAGAEVVAADAPPRLGDGPVVRALSDAEGRFVLNGLTEGTDATLEVRAAGDAPYLGVGRTVGGGRRAEAVEFRLRLGIWATGRVVDPTSGRPRRAQVEAFARLDDLTARPVEGTDRPLGAVTQTDDDGRFRLPMARGRGFLAATTGDPHDPVGGGLDAWDPADLPRAEGRPDALATFPAPLAPRRVNAVVAVGPAVARSAIAATIEVGPTPVLRGRVVGPDGAPLRSSVVAWNLVADGPPVTLVDGQFEVLGLVSGRPRRVDFRSDEAALVGSLEIQAAQDGPVEVRLRPWATYELGVGDATEHPIDGRFWVVEHNSGVDPAWGERAAPPIRDQPLPDGRHVLSGFNPALTYDVLFRSPSLGDILIMDRLQLRAGSQESRGIYAVRADRISAL